MKKRQGNGSTPLPIPVLPIIWDGHLCIWLSLSLSLSVDIYVCKWICKYLGPAQVKCALKNHYHFQIHWGANCGSERVVQNMTMNDAVRNLLLGVYMYTPLTRYWSSIDSTGSRFNPSIALKHRKDITTINSFSFSLSPLSEQLGCNFILDIISWKSKWYQNKCVCF